MRMTGDQLYKALERDYTAFCGYKNKESVQEVIKISEQLKRDPNLDLGHLMGRYQNNLEVVKLAELQLNHLKTSLDVYAPSLIFLITQGVSVFRLLEAVPLAEVKVRLKTIEKFDALMQEREQKQVQRQEQVQDSKKLTVGITEDTLKFMEDLFR